MIRAGPTTSPAGTHVLSVTETGPGVGAGAGHRVGAGRPSTGITGNQQPVTRTRRGTGSVTSAGLTTTRAGRAASSVTVPSQVAVAVVAVAVGLHILVTPPTIERGIGSVGAVARTTSPVGLSALDVVKRSNAPFIFLADETTSYVPCITNCQFQILMPTKS